MPNSADIQWFKNQFAARIAQGIVGTPFSVDMLTAIACQETGYIWANLRKQGLGLNDILRLCAGDTIDAKPGGGGRSAFPRNKAALLAHPKGQQMFDVARQLLVEMAHYITSYGPVATNPNKFCHGFGLFQYDLQFFDADPDYFMSGGYAQLDRTLAKCVGELKNAAKKVGVANKAALTDEEAAAVAIAYNTGRYNPAKKLKQGYYDGQRYYGENFMTYLQAAHAVPTPQAAAATHEFLVKAATTLNLRSAPDKDADNVIAALPDGLHLQVFDGAPVNGFRQIETQLGGGTLRGYAWSAYLVPA